MRIDKLIVGAASVALFLLLWQGAVALNLIDSFFVSSPFRIWLAGRELWHDPDFWRDVRISATEFAAGYAAAAALAIPLGLATGGGQRGITSRARPRWPASWGPGAVSVPFFCL